MLFLETYYKLCQYQLSYAFNNNKMFIWQCIQMNLTSSKSLSSEAYSPKYEKLPNKSNCVCKNITERMTLQKNVCSANLALFVYVSTHCVETVKQLNYKRYFQLTRWCNGDASALGARGYGFNSRLWQGFLCFSFGFVVVVVFSLFVKKHIFVTKFCNPFCNVNLFSILNILQDL